MIIFKFFKVTFLFCAASIFIVLLICNIIGGPEPPGGSFSFIFMYSLFGYLFFLLEKNSSNKKANRKKVFMNKVWSISNRYMKELADRKMDDIEEDGYGNIILNHWYSRDIPYFIESVVKKEMKVPFKYLNDVIDLVDCISNMGIEKFYLKKEKLVSDVERFDFGKSCADVLGKNGWCVVVPDSAGDEMCDFIAEKNEVTVFVKCLFKGSVVDENVILNVSSCREKYVTDYAVIVSEDVVEDFLREDACSEEVVVVYFNDLGLLDEVF